jgi:hypothetical protein
MWRTSLLYTCMYDTRGLWYTSHSCYRCLSICLHVTPRHLSQHGRNRCHVPLARKQQHIACCKKLTSQVLLQGSRETEVNWCEVRTVWQVVQNLPLVWCAVTLLFETFSWICILNSVSKREPKDDWKSLET